MDRRLPVIGIMKTDFGMDCISGNNFGGFSVVLDIYPPAAQMPKTVNVTLITLPDML
jgi:hypothetical protein